MQLENVGVEKRKLLLEKEELSEIKKELQDYEEVRNTFCLGTFTPGKGHLFLDTFANAWFGNSFLKSLMWLIHSKSLFV